MIRTMLAPVLLAMLVPLVSCGNDHGSGDDDGGNTFQPDPPEVYVAKVKNLLVGLPPTDDEIAQVRNDPNALGGLVDAWMALPQYDDKMRVFFELAFQQTQISDLDFVALVPPRGMGDAFGIPTLIQNASESFARTVLELQKEGRPFTEAFTTNRFMMTPALMELYAFMDAYKFDNDGKVTDDFKTAFPTLQVTLTSKGAKPTFAQSVDSTDTTNFMHWFVPGLENIKYANQPNCEGQDTIVFDVDARDLHASLYGEVPSHKADLGGGCNRRNSTTIGQLAPADFSTWKMVTIRPPVGGEKLAPFYNVPKFRTATELVLHTAHVGFFSTPAFFANWPTNDSNQMRVTTNQALIVALGSQVDGTDATEPTSTPGLDETHATPGSSCYGCHALLDPTRSIFSSTYSWFYAPQTDTSLKQQKGLFAFQGVIQNVVSIQDFATTLATHPLVPAAWAQKLCYYINSAACDATDPAFQALVDGFTTANSWNALVKSIVTSPITTNVSETKTWDTNNEVVAIARRDHLCANLNHRLGLVDICGLDATLGKPGKPTVISQIVSGLPSDGYGRGATIPVLPNQPTLFFRAGLENICAQIAGMVVDAPTNADQPNAKRWSSSDPHGAIADIVATVMGLAPSDPRNAEAVGTLEGHFAAAQQAPYSASATTAMQSVFVTACLSPSFVGIGM